MLVHQLVCIIAGNGVVERRVCLLHVDDVVFNLLTLDATTKAVVPSCAACYPESKHTPSTIRAAQIVSPTDFRAFLGGGECASLVGDTYTGRSSTCRMADLVARP